MSDFLKSGLWGRAGLPIGSGEHFPSLKDESSGRRSFKKRLPDMIGRFAAPAGEIKRFFEFKRHFLRALIVIKSALWARARLNPAEKEGRALFQF